LFNIITNDFNEFINIVILNLKIRDNELEKIIEINLDDICNNTIKKNINIHEIIDKIVDNNVITEWINFINNYNQINKIVNNIEFFNTFGYTICSVEEYYIFLIINESNIVNDEYDKYDEW
jgi:hypothetical protein